MGSPTRKVIFVWLHSPLSKRGVNKKLYHPWSGPYKIVKKLSDANYRIEQLQGRRNRKIVHFDRLKLCPPNIRLNEEQVDGQEVTDLQNVPSEDTQQTELSPVGQNLQIIDYDDEELPVGPNEADTATAMLPSVVPNSGVPSSRYPRREHRPPIRFNDFMALNCVKDGTSS